MSGLVFEKLTQFLSAGQVWRLTIAANFFRIAAASWPVKVRILKAGRILGEMDGWQAGDFVRDVDFDAVEVEAGSIAQTVTVQIAGGGVGSDRVLGEVSVIDGAEAITKANRAFYYEQAQQASAGNYLGLQLFNPVGSGKTISITQISFKSSSAGAGGLLMKQGALENLFAGAPGPTNHPVSKLSGGARSVTERRTEEKAAQTFYPSPMAPLWWVDAAAGAYYQVSMKEPVIIEEGWGALFTQSGATGSKISVSAEFTER